MFLWDSLPKRFNTRSFLQSTCSPQYFPKGLSPSLWSCIYTNCIISVQSVYGKLSSTLQGWKCQVQVSNRPPPSHPTSFKKRSSHCQNNRTSRNSFWKCNWMLSALGYSDTTLRLQTGCKSGVGISIPKNTSPADAYCTWQLSLGIKSHGHAWVDKEVSGPVRRWNRRTETEHNEEKKVPLTAVWFMPGSCWHVVEILNPFSFPQQTWVAHMGDQCQNSPEFRTVQGTVSWQLTDGHKVIPSPLFLLEKELNLDFLWCHWTAHAHIIQVCLLQETARLP